MGRRAALAIAFALAPGTASAGGVGIGFETFGGVFRQGAGVDVQPSVTSLRTLPAATLPAFGPTGFAGVGARLEWADRGPIVLDPMVVRFAGAFGPTSRTLGGIDGTLASVDPGSMLYGSLSTGIGFRAKRRRWMFGATMDIGASLMSAHAVVYDGTNAVALDVQPSFSFMMDLDLEACRRIDPTSRVCIVLRPHVYDFGFFNGASIALRWEIGR